MWLPAVLGVMTRRCGDLLVREPAGQEPQHLDLARGQPGRALAPPADAVAGGVEHGVDRGAVHPPGAHLGRSSAAASSADSAGRCGRGSRIAW